jgi:hypothetical protein
MAMSARWRTAGRKTSAHIVFATLLALAWAPAPGRAIADSHGDDTYVLFGVDPNTVRIDIEEATIEDGAVAHFDHSFPWHLYGPADDGFILAKVKPGVQLAIQATHLSPIGLLPGPRFKPCDGTIAFQAPAGSVAYVTSVAYDYGGVSYGWTGQTIHFQTHYTQDLEGARAYLKQHHPELADKLQQAAARSVRLPPALSCLSP